MRIGVLRTQVPFVIGGAERHVANLVAALQARGHEAVEITVPFKWYPGDVLADHIRAAKLLDVSEVVGVQIDLAIGLKFPAYLARHPNMVFWIIHQHRQAYDLWEAGTSDLLDDPQGETLRALIQSEDRAAFEASPHPLFANSCNVAGRLKHHLGLAAAPLYHPPPNAEALRQGNYGDYIFAPGRINPTKRLELSLEALCSAPAARLVVAGTAENPAYQTHLMQLADGLGVSARVNWLGAVNDATLVQHYAEARAVAFVPQDEDYGYITLEAMLSGKPVITVMDAGGPLEFITDGAEGLVTPPDVRALGAAFQHISEDAALAERLGQAGYARYMSQDISWDHVVETLTGQAHAPAVPDVAPPPMSTVDLPGADKATAQLASAVAPLAAPGSLPFANIWEVLEAYTFDDLPASLGREDPPVDMGLAEYLSTHWTRYVATLRQIEGLEVTRALDVGVFPPFVFQALLANQFPGVEMCGIWVGPEPFQQSVCPRAGHDVKSFDIRLEVANAERDPWPYPDNSFDLVSGMEILEHLALDPFFFYCEAARVLKPGGHFLLTTPNVNSHRGLWKAINNIAPPYSFGIFVPSDGVYGHHNREYAPQELAMIGKAAGFETMKLQTLDVYDRHIEPEMAQMLVARGDDLNLRGENIQYLGRKIGSPQGVPAGFYHGDPTRMYGTLSVTETEPETGLVTIEVKNTSRSMWPVAGDRATCFLAEWINGAGELRYRHLMQPLVTPLMPGEACKVRMMLSGVGPGSLRLHLFQQGVGVFTGRGRASPLTLPCSEDIFLNLVETTPLPKGAS